ncbi:MAG TPA: hypothetical protein VLK25_13230 [Allosphingosinicella sp.]|nr:hypothetical protein [Allosphingosinicella sp.]
MSRFASWDISTWIWACLWCLMILLGVFQLLDHLRGSGEPARRWYDLVLGGPVFIGLGLVQLLALRPDHGRAPFDIGFGIFMVAAGLWLLLFGAWFAVWRQRRYDAQLANRLARGEDAYFEELRELEAYPPHAPPASSMQYVLGALYVTLGGAMIAANLNR